MIIVKLWGGLGNQMFQYSLYRVFALRGVEAAVDLSYYCSKVANSTYELNRVFGLSPRETSKKELSDLADYRMTIYHRIKKRIAPKPTHFLQRSTGNVGYDASILNMRNAYLEGYFQSSQYFKGIEIELREEFDFALPISSHTSEAVDHIRESESVAVHIRRGDYLKGMEGTVPLSESTYYSRAMDEVLSQHRDAEFFVFSNDPLWCRLRFADMNNINIVDWNRGTDSWQDMYLMSQCKHNIIADSSFSWWAAWLNRYSNKDVFAPSKWLPSDKLLFSHILENAWITVER